MSRENIMAIEQSFGEKDWMEDNESIRDRILNYIKGNEGIQSFMDCADSFLNRGMLKTG
jgi:hypothetical protein